MYLNSAVVVLVSVFCYVECACPDIISKSSWGARSPKKTKALRSTPPWIVVHHSDTPACNSRSACESRVKNIQTHHIDHNGWDDIGYNFLIGGDGNIYEGRGWGIHGAHVPRYNAKSIGICLIGDFQNTNPPSNQLQALENLIKCAGDTNKVTSNYRVIGHRQGGATKCPGDNLFNKIKTYSRWEPNPS
ncbi:peptidoglycan-recognition protein SC2 [Anoplophora glabripennis]|nr:peptidoglycan-recognition protein SC2 [Anoplophora glabripennis]